VESKSDKRGKKGQAACTCELVCGGDCQLAPRARYAVFYSVEVGSRGKGGGGLGLWVMLV